MAKKKEVCLNAVSVSSSLLVILLRIALFRVLMNFRMPCSSVESDVLSTVVSYNPTFVTKKQKKDAYASLSCSVCVFNKRRKVCIRITNLIEQLEV